MTNEINKIIHDKITNLKLQDVKMFGKKLDENKFKKLMLQILSSMSEGKCENKYFDSLVDRFIDCKE